jgi:hypothetical protein
MSVSKEFMRNFETVTSFYRCDNEEIEQIKETVRNNYDLASLSFACMAAEIECTQPGIAAMRKIKDILGKG